jgi:hypothetical protein
MTSQIAIVCFRFVPDALRDANQSLDKTILERVDVGGAAFWSGTVLRGRFALRAGILHYGTTEDDLGKLVEIVRRAAETQEADRWLAFPSRF